MQKNKCNECYDSRQTIIVQIVRTSLDIVYKLN